MALTSRVSLSVPAPVRICSLSVTFTPAASRITVLGAMLTVGIKVPARRRLVMVVAASGVSAPGLPLMSAEENTVSAVSPRTPKMAMARLLTVLDALAVRAPGKPSTFDDAAAVSTPVVRMPVTKALTAVCVAL